MIANHCANNYGNGEKKETETETDTAFASETKNETTVLSGPQNGRLIFSPTKKKKTAGHPSTTLSQKTTYLR